MKKVIRRPRKKIIVPKRCAFCLENKIPSYADVKSLLRYTTERGKIIPRSRSGLCALHQRRLALSIKHARHLSLMPFIVQG